MLKLFNHPDESLPAMLARHASPFAKTGGSSTVINFPGWVHKVYCRDEQCQEASGLYAAVGHLMRVCMPVTAQSSVASLLTFSPSEDKDKNSSSASGSRQSDNSIGSVYYELIDGGNTLARHSYLDNNCHQHSGLEPFLEFSEMCHSATLPSSGAVPMSRCVGEAMPPSLKMVAGRRDMYRHQAHRHGSGRPQTTVDIFPGLFNMLPSFFSPESPRHPSHLVALLEYRTNNDCAFKTGTGEVTYLGFPARDDQSLPTDDEEVQLHCYPLASSSSSMASLLRAQLDTRARAMAFSCVDERPQLLLFSNSLCSHESFLHTQSVRKRRKTPGN
jgi:hypothetical protein